MQTNPINVLIVEDNPGDATLLAEKLTEIGSSTFQVAYAESLAVACRIVEHAAFDIAFLDLDLPDSQGLQTVERFRERVPQIPVIVLTSRGEETLGIAAVQLGAADYLSKGHFDKSQLERSIYYSIERHRILSKSKEFGVALHAAASQGLRTPLTVIQGNISLVLDGVAGPLSAEQMECLSAAAQNCERLGTFVGDLTEEKLDPDWVESHAQKY